MAESEEELKSLLMKVKEKSWKSWLKTQHSKNKDHGIWSHYLVPWQIDGEKVEAVLDFIFLGSRINEYGDCSHKIKRHLLLGKKAMTNLDSILKNRGVTLPTKVHIGKAMVFHVQIWELENKKGWVPKNWCLWTVMLKTLESPLDCKEVKPVNPKGNQPWIFIEGLMLKLKLQSFGHLMQRTDSLEKTLCYGERGGRGVHVWERM